MSNVDWGALKAMTDAGMSEADIRAFGTLNTDVNAILERYPQLAGFIDHPELGQLLRDAAANQWGPEELQGQLYKTDWYQKTWADFRRVEVLKSTDPAEWAKQVEQAGYEVMTLMGTLGIDISKNKMLVPLLTENYLRHGKDDWFLFNELGKILIKDTSLVGKTGELAASADNFRQMANDYLLDFGDNVYTKHAVNVWRRLDSEDGIRFRMQQDAIKRFGHLADELKRGLTVREALQPLTSAVARTLELRPEDIDLMDSRWRDLHSFTDPDTGKVRTMTITEAERWARHQNEFEQTKTARDEAHQLALRIMQDMGEIKL